MFLKKLKHNFTEERNNRLLWVALLFVVGIHAYYQLFFKQSSAALLVVIKSAALLTPITLLVLLFLHFKRAGAINSESELIFIVWFFIKICWVPILGFSCALISDKANYSPVLDSFYHKVQISGQIESINRTEYGLRVLIKKPAIQGLGPQETPASIRLSVKDEEYSKVNVSDYITVKALLFPLPKSVYPNSFDFARNLYFQKVYALGKADGEMTVLKKSSISTIDQVIKNVRKRIIENLQTFLSKDVAGVAAGLLIGDTGLISEQTKSSIKRSGLYHLLSVSGFHMVVVVGMTFFLFCNIIIFVPKLPLIISVRKISAIIAIIISFFYLMLVEYPTPAVRSYIMSSLALLALFFDRFVISGRTVAIAAILILAVTPSSIYSVSFYLSFFAILSLLSIYGSIDNAIKGKMNFYYNTFLGNIVKNTHLYFIGISLSSVVIGLVTAPIVMYNFNQNANLSIFANLFAIPITSFIIMPVGLFVVLSSLFVNFDGLNSLFEKSLNLLMKIATFVGDVPISTTLNKQIPTTSFALIMCAIVWLLFNSGKWRFFGLALIVPALIIYFLQPIPSLIIDQYGKNIAFLGNDSRYYLLTLSPKKSSFIHETWKQKLGVEEFIPAGLASKDTFNCNQNYCIYKKDSRAALILKSHKYLNFACSVGDVVIDLASQRPYICPSTYISKNDLKKYGTHVLYMEKSLPKVKILRNDGAA